MELKFKRCSLYCKNWTLTDDKIIYGKKEIPLSKIVKVCPIKESMGELSFTFWAERDGRKKLFIADCWISQRKEFYQAERYIRENYGTTATNMDKLFAKDIKDMEPWERERAVDYIEEVYRNRQLDYMSYITLKAKYSGTKIGATELQFAAAIGNAQLQQSVDQAKAKEATKTIVKDAVIGGVVAGPAGAVVGAIVGKNQADSKKEHK